MRLCIHPPQGAASLALGFRSALTKIRNLDMVEFWENTMCELNNLKNPVFVWSVRIKGLYLRCNYYQKDNYQPIKTLIL